MALEHTFISSFSFVWRAATLSPHFKGEEAGAERKEPLPSATRIAALGQGVRGVSVHVCALGQQLSPGPAQRHLVSGVSDTPISLPPVPLLSSVFRDGLDEPYCAHVTLLTGDPDSDQHGLFGSGGLPSPILWVTEGW